MACLGSVLGVKGEGREIYRGAGAGGNGIHEVEGRIAQCLKPT